MNIKASKMTLGVTCVMERIVVTHLRKPGVGMASAISGEIGLGAEPFASSTAESVTDASNQKRHVS